MHDDIQNKLQMLPTRTHINHGAEFTDKNPTIDANKLKTTLGISRASYYNLNHAMPHIPSLSSSVPFQP